MFLDLSDESKEWASRSLMAGPLETGFTENFDAGLKNAWHNMMSISKSWYEGRYQDELLDDQRKAAEQYGITLPSASDVNRDYSMMNDPYAEGSGAGGVVAAYQKGIEELRKKTTGRDWFTLDEARSKAQTRTVEEAKQARVAYEDVSSRATTGGWWGGMAGIAAGSMSDPVNIGITLATAPLAFEGLAAVMAGNAAINVAGEAAVQFAPGGVRDWQRELGLSEAQVGGETVEALVGAGVGGAVLSGALYGVGKGLGAMVRKFGKDGVPADPAQAQTMTELKALLQGNPAEARAAMDSLSAKIDTLPPDIADQVRIIQQAQKIEDAVAFDALNTKLTMVDAERLTANLADYQKLARAIVDDTFEAGDLRLGRQDVLTMEERISNLEGVKTDIESGKLTPEEIKTILSSVVDEDRFNDFDHRVNKYNENPKADVSYKKTVDELKAMLGGKFDADSLVAKGFEPTAAARLAEIKQQLEGKLKPKEKARLEKEFNDIANNELTAVEGQLNAIAAQEAKSPSLVEKAEISAARELLDEAILVEKNKAEYVKLMASNPHIDPSDMRLKVAFGEMRNRLANGEDLNVDDFLTMIPEKDRTWFEYKFQEKGLKDAVDAFYQHQLKGVSKQGKEVIDNVVRNINEIVERFDSEIKPVDFMNALKRQADMNVPLPDPQQAIKALDAFVNDKEAQIKLQQVIRDNINSKDVVYIDEDGKAWNMADLDAKIKEDETIADIISKCPY